MVQEQALVLARGTGMQVARTNRWSALGTVGGLIESGIGASWAAMAISAAASPITLMPITGLLVGGLILLALSDPGRHQAAPHPGAVRRSSAPSPR
jgi:hypothetical protein